jgi:hypothetical protein
MEFLPVKKLDLGLDKRVRVVPAVFLDVGVHLLDKYLTFDGRILRGELGVVMAPPQISTIDYYAEFLLKWAARGISLDDIRKLNDINK